MKYRQARAVCRMVMTEEKVGRLREGYHDTDADIIVDLHGMSVSEAERFLKNVIALTARKLHRFVLMVVHGYRHGTALQEMVRQEPGKISTYIKGIRTFEDNPGRTDYVIVG